MNTIDFLNNIRQYVLILSILGCFVNKKPNYLWVNDLWDRFGYYNPHFVQQTLIHIQKTIFKISK